MILLEQNFDSEEYKFEMIAQTLGLHYSQYDRRFDLKGWFWFMSKSTICQVSHKDDDILLLCFGHVYTCMKIGNFIEKELNKKVILEVKSDYPIDSDCL